MKYFPLSTMVSIFLAVSDGSGSLVCAEITPYAADANTLMLFHLDETNGGSVTVNSGARGGNAYAVNMSGATATPPLVTGALGAGAYPGFGNSAQFSASAMIGWDYNASGAYQGDVSGAGLSADKFVMSTLNMGNGGPTPWTIEAMIYPSNIAANQEIISTDSSATARGFQFRINSAGQLELNCIATGPDIKTAIPATGIHAYAANTWFHAAATYDGTQIKLYWTRADVSPPAANLISTTVAAVGTTFGAATGPLCIGGENRGPNNECFQGRIDEVRISSVARTAAQFLFSATTGDFDNDGLPDSWEMQYFGSLAQTALGDPDGDGFSNAQEYAAGSNPANALATPADTDGDGLPDAWEQTYLGGLSVGAFDDPDGDGYTNLSELLADTLPQDAASQPGWQAPRVAFLRDSIVATDACLMPTSAPYGRAINGVSFQDHIIQTFRGYQYTAWYNTTGTTQNVWLARRTVNSTSTGVWERVNTLSEFLNGDEGSWDAHNVIAFGICPNDGTLHLTWDHHGATLRYRRSVAGLCTTNKAAWGESMMNPEQNWLVAAGQTVTNLTYPQFRATPDGGLVMNWRYGASGDGDQLIRFYNPATGTWNNQILFVARTGSYNGDTSRNAYVNGLDFGPDGKIHVTWTWREGAGTANHDICYACSSDSGVTWRNNSGTVVADTSVGQSVSLNSAGIIIKPLDTQQLLINQQAQTVDTDGRVHVLMLHRREDPGYEYPNFTTATYSTIGTAYYHSFRDPGTGVWSQRRLPPTAYPVGSRPKIACDASGNLYAVYLTYNTTVDVVPGYTSGKLVVASTSKVSQYTDWEVVHVLDTTFNGEPLLDRDRLLADGILSVYMQENSTNTSAVGTPLHVIDFAVNVAAPGPITLNGPAPTSLDLFGPDTVTNIMATLNSTYQLQTTTDLRAPWQSVGPFVTGRNGLLALPHGGGALHQRRFYRVVISN